MRDVLPPIEVNNGRITSLTRLRDCLIGYLGTAGELGPAAPAGRHDPPAGRRRRATRKAPGVVAAADDGFTIFSFNTTCWKR